MAWRILRDDAPPAAEVEAGAPAWWHGDEEAADSFLRAMGVHLG